MSRLQKHLPVDSKEYADRRGKKDRSAGAVRRKIRRYRACREYGRFFH